MIADLLKLPPSTRDWMPIAFRQVRYAAQLGPASVSEESIRLGYLPPASTITQCAEWSVLIVLKTGLPLRELGMVVGKNGFLSILFAPVWRWVMPSLLAARRKALWACAATTGSVAFIVVPAEYLQASVL